MGKKNTAAFAPLIDQRASSLLNEVKAAYQLQAAQRRLSPTEPVMTTEEKEAANLVVEPVAAQGQRGAGQRGGGGGGGANAGPGVPQEMGAEFNILLNQHKTVLEIRDFLSGEFTPLPLADLMRALKAREAAGTLRLVPKSGR
jgi:aminopeptidase YwaD